MVEKNLRLVRGQLISEDENNWSLSKIVNVILVAGMLSTEKLDHDELQLLHKFSEKRKINIEIGTLQNLAEKLCKKPISTWS